MTDERGIGPMPPAMAGAAGSVSDDSSSLEVRTGGSILGAILALGAVALAVRLDAIVVADPRDSPIAVVFGPDGIAHGDVLATALVWAVAPAAAAIAGFTFALPAVRRIDGSGLWMGAATYVVAIGISPLVFLPSAAEEGIDLLRNLGTVPFLWLFAGAALGPLLAVCLIAGPIWATVLRLTRARAGSPRPSVRGLPVWPIAALTVCVGLGWAIVMAMLSIGSNATFD